MNLLMCYENYFTIPTTEEEENSLKFGRHSDWDAADFIYSV